MKCCDCPYYYPTESGCQWMARAPGEIPPCEEEDIPDEEDYTPSAEDYE